MKEDLTAVVERFMPKIKKLAKYVRGQYPKAALEDLQQAGTEGLLKAMERYDQYDPSKSELSTWVHPWIRGEMLMLVRRETAMRRYEHEAVAAVDDAGRSGNARAAAFQEIAEAYEFEAYAGRTPEDAVLTQEEIALVDAYYAELSENEREFFRLRYTEELTLEEIGLALGYSRSGVCRMEERLRAKLRRRRERGG